MQTQLTCSSQRYCALAVVMGGLVWNSARADVLVDRPPFEWGGGPGADTSFYGGPHGVPEWELSADYFEFPSPESISLIVWYGFYGSAFGGGSWDPPSGDELMRIRFYDARPSDGLPGSVLFEESFLNPRREATKIHVDDGQLLYQFHTYLDVEFSAVANRRYWLEITQIDDIDSCYRWSFSDSEATFSYFNLFVTDWRYSEIQAGLAFRLEGVPEPQALLLLVPVVPFLRLRRRRLLHIR